MASLVVALLAGSAAAAQWTVTSYYAVKPTTSVWTYYDETYTETATLGLKDEVTPTAEALSSSTLTDTYDGVEYVEVYYDGADIDDDDIMTTTSYDYGYGDVYTYYVQAIEYTAPTSCPTPFTVQTYTEIDIPAAVVDQLTYQTASTSVYTYADGDTYTQVTAYVEDVVSTLTVDTATDWVYTYFIADCRNPTATGAAYYGPGYDDDDDYYGGGGTYGGGGNYWGACMGDSYCSGLAIYVIVLASLIPALFLLGFLENYFWFRRMMTGKFSLRFGTVLWIFLLLPMLCFTRQCPARDPETQKALRAQWKTVGFGKAIGLWFRWGFRHKYPVELLGAHPLYHNPAPGQAQMAQMPPGPPPPGGYVYYAPGPAPDGQPGFPPQGPPQGPPPEGWKGHPGMPPHMGVPPPGMVLYYPQYPPQAHQPPQQAPSSAPSPVSALASPQPDVPQPAASPQPSASQSYSAPPQELGPQNNSSHGHDTNTNTAGTTSGGQASGSGS